MFALIVAAALVASPTPPAASSAGPGIAATAQPAPPAAAGSPAPASPAAAPSAPLPACVLAKVAPAEPIDSKTGQPGQPFKFTVSSIVDPANAFPTVAPGAAGWGQVAVVRHGKTGGDAGLLVLETRYLIGTDGRHVPVTLVRTLNGLFMGKSHNSPGVLGWIPYVGYVSGAYDAFHKGGDVVVMPADLMTVAVGDDAVTGACAVPTAAP